MTNKELYIQIAEEALNSIYWSRKASFFFTSERYNYAPMVETQLWQTLGHSDSEVIGWEELETELGRRLRVEELTVCPLSVSYLLFGSPIITDTENERNKLNEFYTIIKSAIARAERRTIGYEIKRLTTLIDNAF